MHKNEAVEVSCTPSLSILDRFNTVLVIFVGGIEAILFLPALELMRGCNIHVNKAFKVLRRKRRTRGVLAHCWAHVLA